MWAFLVNLVSGGALGAVAGLGGTAIQKYFEFKNDGQKNLHEIEMKKLDIETMKAEAESKFEVSRLEAGSREAVAETEAFQASFSTEPQSYADKSHLTPGQNWLMTILDFIRGLVRPGLTAYMSILVSLLLWQALAILKREGMTINPEEAYELVGKIVQTILALFTACTLWYFGQRMSEGRGNKR